MIQEREALASAWPQTAFQGSKPGSRRPASIRKGQICHYRSSKQRKKPTALILRGIVLGTKTADTGSLQTFAGWLASDRGNISVKISSSATSWRWRKQTLRGAAGSPGQAQLYLRHVRNPQGSLKGEDGTRLQRPATASVYDGCRGACRVKLGPQRPCSPLPRCCSFPSVPPPQRFNCVTAASGPTASAIRRIYLLPPQHLGLLRRAILQQLVHDGRVLCSKRGSRLKQIHHILRFK